ncbi:MAG: hypothetical protein GX568_08160 [Candidatus Gastranaerophilales bacterium]|nr:hypothetical protein [Candidatus Gastranaerophilales bacterium]
MLLDCTLRDGGNRNNWNFSDEVVEKYLKTVHNAGISFVELGLRLLKKDNTYGKLAYCPDEYLQSISIPEQLRLAVMIKAKEFLDCDAEKNLDSLFDNKKNSRIDVVRIAAAYHKASKCRQICDMLKDKGYDVALNLTKVTPDCEDVFLRTVQTVIEWKNFDILYFADTFGQLTPQQTGHFVRLIRQKYDGTLGFHGHNDKGFALENSLTALENGVNIVDSTLFGIGKGIGNLPTEVIAAELNKKFGQKYNLQAFSSSPLNRNHISFFCR